jgi:beta-lactamase class A
MCSSFKLLLAGAVLSRAEAKKESLDRRVPCGETEMLSYAPVTRVHLPKGGMTVSDLCAAVIETSDNTAAMPEAAVYSNRFGL